MNNHHLVIYSIFSYCILNITLYYFYISAANKHFYSKIQPFFIDKNNPHATLFNVEFLKCGNSSGVERRIAKAKAAGSNPVSRSSLRCYAASSGLRHKNKVESSKIL